MRYTRLTDALKKLCFWKTLAVNSGVSELNTVISGAYIASILYSMCTDVVSANENEDFFPVKLEIEEIGKDLGIDQVTLKKIIQSAIIFSTESADRIIKMLGYDVFDFE